MVEKNTNPKLAGCEETSSNKTICVHLNVLAGLATIFSGVFPTPEYIPQQLLLRQYIPAPYTPVFYAAYL